MTNPLDDLEREMAELEFRNSPDVDQATVEKIQRVSRAAALATLSHIVIDEGQDIAMRIGAANIVLMATSTVNTEPDFFKRG